jgi:hypothetical protein
MGPAYREIGRSAHDLPAALADECAVDDSQAAQALVDMDDFDEEDRVRRWRLEQFLRLGFDLSRSAVMAAAPVDLASARKLVRLGCPLDVAAEILL